jgi:hypothetical protein
MTDNKILTVSARITSYVFHPLLIPTFGFLLLFNSGFYFAMIPWKIEKFVLLIVFLSTCVLPALSISLLALNPKFDIKLDKNTDRTLPLILSSIFYYMGYLLLKNLPIFPVYQFFLIASIFVQISLLFINVIWKISAHSAAIGGLLGGFLALSFRLQENPMLILISLVIVAGMVGTSRLILEKHTNPQVYAGFSLGFLIMISVFLYL